MSHYLKRTNKIILIQESSQQWWNTWVSNIRWASWNRDQPLLATVRGFLKDRFLLSEAGSPIHEALISYTWNSNWNCACAVIKGSFRCWVSSQTVFFLLLDWPGYKCQTEVDTIYCCLQRAIYPSNVQTTRRSPRDLCFLFCMLLYTHIQQWAPLLEVAAVFVPEVKNIWQEEKKGKF